MYLLKSMYVEGLVRCGGSRHYRFAHDRLPTQQTHGTSAFHRLREVSTRLQRGTSTAAPRPTDRTTPPWV